MLEAFAAKLIDAIEDPPEKPIAPPTPTRNLEKELLQGSLHESKGRVAPKSAKSSSSDQLAADFEALLRQREQLRASLIAEQERRERAEAELVRVGAAWLGTDTQEALAERAKTERRRALDAERESVRREADQQVAKARAEVLMLRKKLGSGAPSDLELRVQVRAALHVELEKERTAARAAVNEQLARVTAERDALQHTLRQTETTHRVDLEVLRQSVRKASEMVAERYDQGFVEGLKQAALALTTEVPSGARQHAGAAAEAPSASSEGANREVLPPAAAEAVVVDSEQTAVDDLLRVDATDGVPLEDVADAAEPVAASVDDNDEALATAIMTDDGGEVLAAASVGDDGEAPAAASDDHAVDGAAEAAITFSTASLYPPPETTSSFGGGLLQGLSMRT